MTIGDGAVIGAGSVVNKDIPPYQVWAGVPVRFICNRYQDESEIPVDTNAFKPKCFCVVKSLWIQSLFN